MGLKGGDGQVTLGCGLARHMEPVSPGHLACCPPGPQRCQSVPQTLTLGAAVWCPPFHYSLCGGRGGGVEGKGAATEPELAGTHPVAVSAKQAQCLAQFMLQVH